ncbi:MAG: sigma-70 family RNA polymerase sigma factor [Pseudomonadales bacterium]|nr:sigma-70 family RNA polymerase sigma factor [Pseudomonadales bacterium]
MGNTILPKLENHGLVQAPDSGGAPAIDLYMLELRELEIMDEDEERHFGTNIQSAIRMLLAEIVSSPDQWAELEHWLTELLHNHRQDINNVFSDKPDDLLKLECILTTLIDTLKVLDHVNNEQPEYSALQSNLLFMLEGLRISRNQLVNFAKLISRTTDNTAEQERFSGALKHYLQLRNQLIEKNLRLVMAQARRYKATGCSLEDIVQNGNLGLIKAADRFDFQRGYRFSTFAVWCIQSAIKYRTQRTRHTIAKPPHLQDQLGRVLSLRDHLQQQLGRPPRSTELAKASGLDYEQVNHLLSLPQAFESTDQNPMPDGKTSLIDSIKDEGSTIEHALKHEQQTRLLDQLMRPLTQRERLILLMRYGIGYPRSYTLHEIATQLGLSFERIRQLQNQATKKLNRSA